MNETKAVSDVRLTIRVDKSLKEQAEILFERLGMNMTTALNVFLRKAVAESAIPFPVSTSKNTGFGPGYTAAGITEAFTDAVQNGIVASKRQGFPVARYDADKKQAYLETADGAWEYINE
ncbi:MAG: type II toxin-antitoxin system RelB/DinJ family antitoxin [Firmicutes bacterium]|nr:type II toxin-antitoxin system RelB/DinJ family antitoxin [Bacillota bacterium]